MFNIKNDSPSSNESQNDSSSLDENNTSSASEAGSISKDLQSINDLGNKVLAEDNLPTFSKEEDKISEKIASKEKEPENLEVTASERETSTKDLVNVNSNENDVERVESPIEEAISVDQDSFNADKAAESTSDKVAASVESTNDESYRFDKVTYQQELGEIERASSTVRLPIARVKKIMKADPVLGIASQESVFLVTKATEYFIESLVVEAFNHMVNSKKKMISRRDLDSTIQNIESLAFLDGIIDENDE